MSDDLERVASNEHAVLKARVEAMQQQAARMAALQQDIGSVNDVCFQMCVYNAVSDGRLGKEEKKCIKQCAARMYDSRNALMQRYFKMMQAEQQKQ